MISRSTWEGSISFGWVNAPVKIYSATKAQEISFNQPFTRQHRINYKRWRPVEKKEIKFNEIRTGFPAPKHTFIPISKKEIDTIKIKTTNTINIKEFIDGNNMHPVLVERSYFVVPDSKRSAS